MSTNGMNTNDDADMAECDGEKVLTMMDVLQEQQDFEDDANAVLGASDEKNCTYTKGYIKRQAIYACLTCCTEAKEDPTKRAGVCLACSLNCHENHELIELYTKRNFRCDCGNPQFNSHQCMYTANKTDLNNDNSYNQNFSGLYCVCHRPYPDPESTIEDEMIQCIICEDWLHSSHLEATVPNNDLYSEMICKACMENNEFLHDYSYLAVNVETGDLDVVTVNGNSLNTSNNGLTSGSEQTKIVNGAKEDSLLDIETKSGQDIDMSEEIYKKSEDFKNTDIIVPIEKNMEESIELTVHKTDTINDVHNEIESQKPVVVYPDSTEVSDVPMECAQIDKTETQTEENVADISTPEDVKTEEPVISEELNSKDQIDKTAVTKTDNEDPPVRDIPTDSSADTGDMIKNVDSEKSEGKPVSESEQLLTGEVSIEQNTDEIESEETKVAVETPNSDRDDEYRILENTTADLIKGNLNEDNITLQDPTNDNEILDEPQKIEETPDSAVPEIDTTCSGNVAEKLVDPITSNDGFIDTEFEAIPEIESEQVTAKAQQEVEDTDTLEVAAKELSDIMEESNERNVTESEESIINNISENTDKTMETQTNDTAEKNEIAVESIPGNIEYLNDSTDLMNKLSNDRESEIKSLANGVEYEESSNKVDETNVDSKLKVVDSTAENKTNGTDEIEMIETNKNEASHSENKIAVSENEHKRKLEDTVQSSTKRSKLDDEKNCIRPRGTKRIHKGATFWPAHFRQKICTCNECLSMYKDLSLLFLLDPEDTVTAYETLGKERIDGEPTTQYEKGLQALSSLDRIQQINALTEYNKMRDKLLDFLKSFKDRKEIVKEDDIKAFFAGMKPRREPDGVYFCR